MELGRNPGLALHALWDCLPYAQFHEHFSGSYHFFAESVGYELTLKALLCPIPLGSTPRKFPKWSSVLAVLACKTTRIPCPPGMEWFLLWFGHDVSRIGQGWSVRILLRRH